MQQERDDEREELDDELESGTCFEKHSVTCDRGRKHTHSAPMRGRFRFGGSLALAPCLFF